MRYFSERDRNGVTSSVPHYTLAEVAEELECCLQTVRRRVEEQPIRTVFFSGKLWINQDGLDLLRGQNLLVWERVGVIGVKSKLEKLL